MSEIITLKGCLAELVLCSFLRRLTDLSLGIRLAGIKKNKQWIKVFNLYNIMFDVTPSLIWFYVYNDKMLSDCCVWEPYPGQSVLFNTATLNYFSGSEIERVIFLLPKHWAFPHMCDFLTIRKNHNLHWHVGGISWGHTQSSWTPKKEINKVV